MADNYTSLARYFLLLYPYILNAASLGRLAGNLLILETLLRAGVPARQCVIRQLLCTVSHNTLYRRRLPIPSWLGWMCSSTCLSYVLTCPYQESLKLVSI